MHQLHEEIHQILRVSEFGEKFPKSEWAWFQVENATNACTSSPQHDPSSQSSQLECKLQEISKISNKTLRLRKL
jgi:hypothetical protein